MAAIEGQVLLAVGLAALATYSLRLGGLMLASRLPKTGRLKCAMDALPGSLLFSLVVPSIVAEGLWGVVATLLIALVVLKSRNNLAAMAVGMAVILFARKAGF